MRAFVCLTCTTFLLLSAFQVRAGDARNREALRAWYGGYKEFQSAEQAEVEDQLELALEGFRRAQTIFRSVQTRFPEWNPPALEMRTELCRERIEALRSRIRETVPGDETDSATDISRAELKARLSAIEQEAHMAHRAFAELRSAIARQVELQNENERLRKLLEADWAERPEAISEELKDALSALVAERQEHESTRRQLQTRLIQQTERNTALREELRGLSLKHLRIQRQLLVHNRTVNDLSAQAEAAQTALQQEKVAHDRARQQNQALADDLAQVRAALSKMEQDLQAFTGGTDNDLRARLVEQIQANQRNQQAYQELKHAANRHQAAAKKLSQELDILQAANISLREAAREHGETDQAALLRELRVAMQYLQLKQVDLEDRHSELQQEHEALFASAETMRRKLEHTNPATGVQPATTAEFERLLNEAKSAQAAARRAAEQAAIDRKLLQEAIRNQTALEKELTDYRSRAAGKQVAEALQSRVINLVNEAKELAAAGAVNQAMGAFDQALALNSDNLDALLGKGQLQLDAGAADQAAETLGRAYRLMPEHPRVLPLLGRAELRSGRPGPAAGFLQLAFQDQPADAELAADLGTAFQELGWLHVARMQLLTAWELDSTRVETATRLVRLHLQMVPPDVKNAKSWYSIARRLGLPADPEIEVHIDPETE